MRTLKALVIVALLASMGGMAVAELQNVEIGGKLRIRGNWFYMDDSDASTAFVEQRNLLNVKADFTDEVSAFVEFDNYNVWGEDFRSLYLTGADGRGAGDVDMYQAYIDAKNMWGTPLSMRVGRQELVFGNEFLFGNNDTAAFFTGLSYDALRLSFNNDVVAIDAVAAKLAEGLGDLGKDDVDLYGLYASYLGIEDVVIDAYWMWIRDDEVVTGENIDLHTVGLRGAGTLGAFDFDANVAYQFGDTDLTRRVGFLGLGRDDIDIDAFGVDVRAGYTFDMGWQPRVFANFAWYEGDDEDLAFDRLFSDLEYSAFLDNVNANLTDVFVYALGVQVMPTEAVALKLVGTYFDGDENWDEIGWEVGLCGAYNYSEDLTFRAGYNHFFADDDFADDADFDYAFVETEIAF
ncbi:MAG TPA: alginate export family protein [Candidatus Hydrogenedentes bacterium]|nr:alginate export family protein [Candidatus Hydrogenedentota bacterium]HQL94502.1 alginate export family protein [Candidatus Hydrogenedentota bacterium]HRZ81104.1 alginate export family protein [Candidatus Hydrogenedentota bacterium]